MANLTFILFALVLAMFFGGMAPVAQPRPLAARSSLTGSGFKLIHICYR